MKNNLDLDFNPLHQADVKQDAIKADTFITSTKFTGKLLQPAFVPIKEVKQEVAIIHKAIPSAAVETSSSSSILMFDLAASSKTMIAITPQDLAKITDFRKEIKAYKINFDSLGKK